MKKFLLFTWILIWTIVAFQQIPITLQSLNKSSNWPPEGYVIVENRGGQKIMITEETDKKLKSINDDMESFANSNKKLRKLGNLKGKLSNKVSNITKEHKFFSENVSCPTCTQSIEESFRLNKINEAESKAKELKKGYEELESAIKLEEEREQTFKKLSSEATKLTHEISKTNTRISGLENQSRDLEQEIQTITEQLKNRTAEKLSLIHI